MGKKVIILLLLLVALIVYTITSFEYKTILSNSNSNDVVEPQKNEFVDSIMNKFNDIKQKVSSTLGEEEPVVEQNTNPMNLELVKDNGNVSMNGILKDEAQAAEVENLLNINREGSYKYNPAITLDNELLQKISELVTPFKDFLSDGSKLAINGDEVTLTGELKDPSYSELLKSIVNRVGLDIDLSSLTLNNKSKTEEIIDTIKDKKINNIKDLAKNEDIVKIAKKVNTEKTQEVQSSINKVLEENKITFERRSTKITNDSFSSVKQVAEILKSNESLNIEIGGHTDSRGAASLNKRISQDRANSVMNALVDLGIDKSRLKAIGYGEDFPIAEDDKDGLSEINRRVEIKVLGE